jgi:hypothetical protein
VYTVAQRVREQGFYSLLPGGEGLRMRVEVFMQEVYYRGIKVISRFVQEVYY